jgi:hypothetical protein
MNILFVILIKRAGKYKEINFENTGNIMHYVTFNSKLY